MPSITGKPRKRYIAFRIHAPYSISRKEFIAALRDTVKKHNAWERVKPWLTIFENNEGILRCAHTAKDEAIELLTSLDIIGKDKVQIKVETLGTSGTIKKAKTRHLGKDD